MSSMRNLFCATVLAVGLLGASAVPSSAAIVLIPAGGNLGTDPNAVFAVSGIVEGNSPTNLKEDFSLTLTAGVNFTALFGQTFTSLSDRITGLTLSLYKGIVLPGNLVDSDVAACWHSCQGQAGVFGLRCYGRSLHSGNYRYILLNRTCGRDFGIKYAGVAAATPEDSAVPEASTWAMMMLGFLGVGFMAYRKRSAGKQLRLA